MRLYSEDWYTAGFTSTSMSRRRPGVGWVFASVCNMYPQLCNSSNVGYKSSDFLKNFPRHSFANSHRLIEVILSFFSLPSTNCAFLTDRSLPIIE